MKMKEVQGWATAVVRAKQLFSQLPAWAFEMAGEQEAEGTYVSSDWFTAHPLTIGELATKIAYSRGWKSEK